MEDLVFGLKVFTVFDVERMTPKQMRFWIERANAYHKRAAQKK